MISIPDLEGPLSSKAPATLADEAEQIGLDVFGVSAQAQVLTAERDMNFLLTTPDGAKYVLKISNPAEEPAVTNLQTSALLHLEATRPSLRVPRIVPALDGSVEPPIALREGRTSVVRLLSYLSGVPLHALPRTRGVRQNLGTLLAELDIGLQNFSHPAQSHSLPWNSMDLPRLEPLLGTVEDEALRGLAERAIRDFADVVGPEIPSLRAQIIYNDLNFYNVLMDQTNNEAVAGLIDFGDIIHAPLVNDVAVAASYHFSDARGSLLPLEEFIASYHRRLKLTDAEIALVPFLIASRMATTVLVASWRASSHPDNKDYILRNRPNAQAGLSALLGQSRDEKRAWINGVCGKA